MGKDDFLRLLITQLRYQDPINPSKPEEFAAQLAQFSSLEGMQNIQTLLQSQLNAGSLSTLAMKADLGASFIGRNVLAAGNQIQVAEDGAARISVDIGTGGGKAVLTIYDASGREVATKDLGFRKGGRQVVETPELPSGSYTYKVSATSLSGAEVDVQTYTSGIIDGVSFSGGQVVLRSGSLEFPLDNVVEVERAPAGTAALAAVTRARIIPSQTE
jgi:flagellar basal-body rod modification protein FlgD